MCPKTSSQKTYTPAAAPAAPLPVADEPDIGETRRQENLKNFGKESPDYRAREEEDAGTSISMS